jgi:hypothetical protein
LRSNQDLKTFILKQTSNYCPNQLLEQAIGQLFQITLWVPIKSNQTVRTRSEGDKITPLL